MFKSVLLASVAVASLTAFATGASAQQITPTLSVQANTNEVIILQNGGNTANVDQTGTNNKAGQLPNSIDLSQSGSNPDGANALADGVYSILQYGSGNNLTVTQAGSNNSVLTKKQNVSSVPNKVSFEGGSFQNGYGNSVSSTQSGTNGQAQFQQIGNSNNAVINAYAGANKTYAGIFQYEGNNNNASINQYGSTDNAYAIVVQQGSGNYGAISQQYTNEYALIAQIGGGNNATIGQSGDTNYASILQNGYGNNAATLQTGTGVGAFTYQSGNSNYASVTQTGLSANAGALQLGNGNNLTIKQH